MVDLTSVDSTANATSLSCINTFRATCRQRTKRLLHSLSKVFIFGYIPLVHSIVLLLEMAIVAQIARRYDQYFDKRPVLTMMVTNSVLNGIADTVAQTVTSIRRRAAHDAKYAKNHSLDIELDEKIDQTLPHHGDKLIPTHSAHHHLPPPFDFNRLARFAFWGFVIAPFQFKWLQFLQRKFPLTANSSTLPTLKRVALDQICFAPMGLVGFFTYMTYAEGGDTEQVKKRLKNVFWPTLKANYMLWPMVQLINFRLMPLQFQLPFASTVGIAWGTYLSLTNSSSEDD
ncbi:hypothetical protein FN846DRAFT_775236 [Sphaerosporella brunnea]|uniref:Protein sym1 n=1 Tax=Sphaerosporella brunnea TaxID=1250544 RepID=A0A5J5F373_9PEZI|nr:hypothetical protein FN846DRAFT_775236 [Sphaerosporella brunnea]